MTNLQWRSGSAQEPDQLIGFAVVTKPEAVLEDRRPLSTHQTRAASDSRQA